MSYQPDMGAPMRTAGYAAAAGGDRLRFIQRVYSLLLASILVAIAAGAMVMNTRPVGSEDFGAGPVPVPAGVVAMADYSLLIWGALLVMLLLGRRIAVTPGLNLVFLFAFTGICGAWAAPSIWWYGVARGAPEVVGIAGALTGIIFVALTVVAFLSKHDFNFLGAGLHMAWIGLVAAALLNGFVFQSDWAMTMVAWGIVVFAGGCILYNTSNMLRRMDERHVVVATICLFVDLLNLFLALLRIVGGRR